MPEIIKISAMTLFAIIAGVAVEATIFHLAPSLPLYFQVIPAFGFGALITLYVGYWMNEK